MIEHLESRRLLSISMLPSPAPADSQFLSTSDVTTLLGQAMSQALPTQVAVVVDREGTVLGILAGAAVPTTQITNQVLLLATTRARTAALFESNHEAFTTRTARFIIQDHFPHPIKNTPGGPLYGVQFSSLIGGDILLPSNTPSLSGDPGGIPLYKNGIAVGAIGVAGDGKDIAARPELIPVTQDALNPDAAHRYNANPKGRVFNGKEESDFDEAVALAGARGYMAPKSIRATNIFIDGLRLPFTANHAAHKHAVQTLGQLIGSGAVVEFTNPGSAGSGYLELPGGSTAIKAGEPELVNATVDGIPGLIRNRANARMLGAGQPASPTTPHVDPQESDPIVGSNDPGGLTVDDVNQIISDAVEQALITRAGIRKPNGIHAVVHIAVVDREGNPLGVFRMQDGTNFSYDVAVQKARTALFFSDDTHAISTRAIGFMSQKSFPPGINTGLAGPLFHLQDALNDTPVSLRPQDAGVGLANGITIFPGGIPLYKNGKLVGAVGISGDGVDQDDLVAYGGAKGFQPAAAIRSDNLSASDATSFILSRLQFLQQQVPLGGDFVTQASKTLERGLRHLRLPYVKFPRLPHV